MYNLKPLRGTNGVFAYCHTLAGAVSYTTSDLLKDQPGDTLLSRDWRGAFLAHIPLLPQFPEFPMEHALITCAKASS